MTHSFPTRRSSDLARAWFCRRGVAASQGRTAHVLARSPRCDRLLDFRPRAGAAGDGLALGGSVGQRLQGEIGRAHVSTPVTNAHLVCRLLLEKKKKIY